MEVREEDGGDRSASQTLGEGRTADDKKHTTSRSLSVCVVTVKSTISLLLSSHHAVHCDLYPPSLWHIDTALMFNTWA